MILTIFVKKKQKTSHELLKNVKDLNHQE